MENKQQVIKQLRSLMIVMIIIIIPGLIRMISSSAFASVRSVDLVMLFFSGLATGVLIITARNYFNLKTDDQ